MEEKTRLSSHSITRYSVIDKDFVFAYHKYMNNFYWLHYGDLSMSKYCKLSGGFVSNDYICEGCNFCGSLSKEDKENEE